MKELQAFASSGLTLYAVLLNGSGQVWNGSAFETLVGANWADYAVALTEAVAGIYLGALPAVALGQYSYAVYERAGASPATTDTLRGTGSILWDGDSEVLPVATDASGHVSISGTKTTLDALNDAPDVSADVGSIKGTTDKLDTALELDGAVYRYTANALEEGPAVAISASTAASISTGALAIRSYHTLAQAITSTYSGNLGAATKLWLAIKANRTDADAKAVVFIEATAGLTVLAGAPYITVAHGTLVVTGNAGAWTVTVGMDEIATGLLKDYAESMLWAECKALVGGSTVAVWDGVCDVSHGLVVAVA